METPVRQIEAMVKELEGLKKGLEGDGPVLDAYLYRSRTRCGKPTCRCMKSEYRHEAWCVSYVESGGSKTRTVALEALAVIRKMTGDYRRLRQARRRLTRLCTTAVRLIDGEAVRRLRSGRALFLQLQTDKNGSSRSA